MPLAVDILADILQNSVFDAGELKRERAVVLQEIGQANDTPDDIIFDLFQERGLSRSADGPPGAGHAGDHPDMIATRVAGYLQRQLRRRRAWCWPPPAMSITTALVEQAERPSRICRRRAAARAEPARYVGGDFREERDLEQVHFVLGFPGFAFSDADYYAASVLSTAWAAACRRASSRRSARSAASSIRSIPSPTAISDGGFFGVYAGTGQDEVGRADAGFVRGDPQLARGLAAAELERARAQLKAGLLMSLESTTARCEQLAQHMLVFGRSARRRRHRRPYRGGRRRGGDAGRRAAVPRAARPLTALGPVGAHRELRPARRAPRDLRSRRWPGFRACPASSEPCLQPSAAAAAGTWLRPPERCDWRRMGRARGGESACLPGALGADLVARRPDRAPPSAAASRAMPPIGAPITATASSSSAPRTRPLVGGISLSNVRRGVAETGSLGYWVGERFARQGFMTAGLRLTLGFCLPAPPPPRRGRLPAAQRPEPPAAAEEPGSARRGYARNISVSTGRGRTMCFSRCCGRNGRRRNSVATARLQQDQSRQRRDVELAALEVVPSAVDRHDLGRRRDQRAAVASSGG